MYPSKLNYLLSALGLLLITATAGAQAPAQPDSIKYDHQEVFDPTPWPVTSGGTRSANGQPGEHYWQNRADYLIKASLSEADKDTTGSKPV
jgi:hypothetical protein